MAKKVGCKCTNDSPFCWHKNPRPSIFFEDRANRPVGYAKLSKSHLATKAVDKAKQEGKTLSHINGISRDREAELLRLREYTTYSRAQRARDDLLGVKNIRVEEDGNVNA